MRFFGLKNFLHKVFQFRADFLAQVQSIAKDIDAAAAGYDTLAEYFEDALDIEFHVGYDKKYRSAKILLCCGDPNIYLDTNTGIIKGIWGSDVVRAFVANDTAQAVDEYFAEMYNGT